MEDDDCDDIVQFYHNCTIMITGGTGFLGKILVEKLLRRFNIKKIFLLIRHKNNMGPADRLEAYFKETIFDRLRNEQPNVFEKVKAIHTNFNAIDLDISDTDKSLLVSEVDIVFNVVASVKFNERLRDAFQINVLGTKKVLDLVMKMETLKSFVHISTLYSNCKQSFIGEKVYEQDFGYEKIIQISRILDDTEFEKMQHCLMDEMPNTYTMTKKCSENLVSHRTHHMPSGIFRPPIVLSTYKQPVPGWTDNLYGPSGICTWSAKGFVHCIHGNSKKKAYMVPGDYCINAIIASAWDINRRFKARIQSQAEIPVYNYTYDNNNLTWGKYMHMARKGLHEPFEKSFWYFSYTICSSKLMYNLGKMFFHTIPAYILDLIALAFGQKRTYIKAYNKISRVISIMSFFGLNEWKIQNDNVKKMGYLLQNKDKLDLEFDITTIDWNLYFTSYMFGIKKYFYKENCEKTDNIKNVYKRLYFAHMICKILIWVLLSATSLRFIWKILMKFNLKMYNI